MHIGFMPPLHTLLIVMGLSVDPGQLSVVPSGHTATPPGYVGCVEICGTHTLPAMAEKHLTGSSAGVSVHTTPLPCTCRLSGQVASSVPHMALPVAVSKVGLDPSEQSGIMLVGTPLSAHTANTEGFLQFIFVFGSGQRIPWLSAIARPSATGAPRESTMQLHEHTSVVLTPKCPQVGVTWFPGPCGCPTQPHVPLVVSVMTGTMS
jgi:hypothetical protein